MSRARLILFCAVTFSIALGCARHAELRPAEGAGRAGDPVLLGRAAMTEIGGVRVEAEGGAWMGSPQVREHVTPLRLTLQNDSERPILVQFRRFALIGPDGERHAALPPWQIEGTVQEPVLVSRHDPMIAPRFVHRGFAIAPYYSPMYPGLTPYTGRFGYDPVYYRDYYQRWAEFALPTPEMLEEALPEGVVAPGGQVSGFLYFEWVDPELPEVEFVGELVDANRESTVGTIRIPFTVE